MILFQRDPVRQVPVPDPGDDGVRGERDRGQLPRARPGRHHAQLHQEGRRGALPQVTHGNKVGGLQKTY